MKINEPVQIQDLDGMGKKRHDFKVNILDMIQNVEVVCRSENTNSMNPKYVFLAYSANCWRCEGTNSYSSLAFHERLSFIKLHTILRVNYPNRTPFVMKENVF